MDAGVARLRAAAGRPSGRLGRRLLQRDARHLRVHRRRQKARRRASAGVRDIRGRLSRGPHRRGDSRRAPGPAASGRPRMTIRPFEPTFMPVGILTAALQELTPRAVRDADPDRAIEDWLDVRARARRRHHPAVGGAASERGRRAARSDARSGGEHARSAAALRPARARRVEAALSRHGRRLSDIGYFDNMLHHDPAMRRKKHDFMRRVFDAAVLLGVARGLRLRRPQPAAQHGREPASTSRTQFVPLLKEAKARGLTYPRRAVSDAGLDDRRQLSQQHRLHARHLDRAAPHLRAAWRRRPVPDSLRPVARDPDGPGLAVDLSVPEGRRATRS